MKQHEEHICTCSITGDMNTELTRQNSWHTNRIKQLITEKILYFAHEHPTSNIEYSYFNTTYNTFTIFEHCIVTRHLYGSIVKDYNNNIDAYKTIHRPAVHRSRTQWIRASVRDRSIYINEFDKY